MTQWIEDDTDSTSDSDTLRGSISPSSPGNYIDTRPEIVPFSSVTEEHIAMLGVEKIFFKHHPIPTVSFNENEVPIVAQLLAYLATVSECCYDAYRATPSMIISQILVAVSQILNLRVPTHRTGICTKMSYNSLPREGVVFVDEDRIPIKTLDSGREFILEGTSSSVLVQWPDKHRRFVTLELDLSDGAQFVPENRQAFVFEAHEHVTDTLAVDCFPEAIAHAMAICRVTGGDDGVNRKRGIRFVVTDGQDWHFMLLRQISDDDRGGWQAHHSYSDQICWNDNRRDKHAMEYIVRLLAQWMDGITPMEDEFNV